MKRPAFSLVEIIIAALILAITSGIFTLSPDIAKSSPKREAEKLAARIQAMTQKAASRRENFSIEIASNRRDVRFLWDGSNEYDEEDFTTFGEYFTISRNNTENTLTYEYYDNTFSIGTTITILRDDGKKYNVVIYREGRIRTSP